jgi:hypothetical protein
MPESHALRPVRGIKQFKREVEAALQEGFNTRYPVWMQLSTDPQQVGSYIDSEGLIGMCDDFSRGLHRDLLARNIRTKIVFSRDYVEIQDDYPEHLYLVGEIERRIRGRQEVVIDPSLGQFIPEHPQVFVGTRRQLRRLVRTSPRVFASEGPDVRSQEIPQAHRNGFFRKIWGERSMSLPTPR